MGVFCSKIYPAKWNIQVAPENIREERDKNQESQAFYGLTFIFLTWSFHLLYHEFFLKIPNRASQ